MRGVVAFGSIERLGRLHANEHVYYTLQIITTSADSPSLSDYACDAIVHFLGSRLPLPQSLADRG